MNSKEYVMPNGKKAVFEYDHDGIGKVTIEAMDMLMGLITDGRKRGEWIDNTSETWTPSKKCSECGLVVHSVATDSTDFHAKTKMNFCPNCGAEMKGAESEG